MKTLKLTFALFLLLTGNLFMVSVALAATPAEPLYFSFEQRLMISYALLAQGESPESKQAIMPRLAAQGLRTAEIGVKEIEVKNFAEFLKAYRGDWPDTNSLALDLQMIEARESRGLPRFVCPSASVQRKINKFIENQNAMLLAEATKRLEDSPELKKELAGKVLSSFSEQLQLKDINSAWAQKVLLTASGLSEELIGTQIHELEHLGEKVSQSNRVSQKDPVAKIVLETLLNGYFTGLGMDSKKLLLSSFLGSDLHASDMEKFELLVQNSGPQLQKLLQVVSRQGDLDPEMAKIFRKLESSVRPVPWSQVQEILEREKGNFDFVYFERKPLGVGSMAQVHRAKIMLNGQRRDVVVRFIKPGIEARVQEDDRILKSIATTLDANPILRKMNFPKISSMVEDITRTVTAELDQLATILRQKLGKTAYERKVSISTESGYKNLLKVEVPAIIEGRSQGALMVQELVFGSKLDKEYLKFQDEIPELKKAVVEKLATLWLNEALFGTGFYHADLHQGNFLLRVEEPVPVLTILDYGMTGVLSKDLQEDVIALGAGFRGLDVNMISQGFWKISNQDKNIVVFSDFEGEVRERVRQISHHEINIPTTNEWILWAIEKGLHPSFDFINLNRGNAIIASMLTEVGSTQTIEKIVERLSFEHPTTIAGALISHRNWSLRSLLKMALNPAKPRKITALRCESIFLD